MSKKKFLTHKCGFCGYMAHYLIRKPKDAPSPYAPCAGCGKSIIVGNSLE